MACKNGICNISPSTAMAAQQSQPVNPPTGSFLTGAPGSFMQVPNFTPEQQQLLSQLLQSSMTGLQNRGQQSPFKFDFGPIEQQARENFQTQTLPSISSRFVGMGGTGATRSSDYYGSLGAAGRGLETDLASLKSQYGLQQEQLGQGRSAQQGNELFNMMQLALQPQNENLYFPSQGGAAQGAVGSAGKVAAFLARLALKYFTGM